MSNWLCDELQVGDTVDIQGANGDFQYSAMAPHQPLLLVATGTGPGTGTGLDPRDAMLLGTPRRFIFTTG